MNRVNCIDSKEFNGLRAREVRDCGYFIGLDPQSVIVRYLLNAVVVFSLEIDVGEEARFAEVRRVFHTMHNELIFT